MIFNVKTQLDFGSTYEGAANEEVNEMKHHDLLLLCSSNLMWVLSTDKTSQKAKEMVDKALWGVWNGTWGANYQTQWAY
jgi:hypothetical protein